MTSDDSPRNGKRVSRRDLVRYGVAGTLGVVGLGSVALGLRSVSAEGAAEVFANDAPQGALWDAWLARGWAKEALHYRKLGGNLQCALCPNECLLTPEDRGRCRNRVHKDGKLYTLAYANPCTIHIDPIEKKPLLHFLPSTPVFSIATAGCSLRCLNCQNWEISQKKPEELKVAEGPPLDLVEARPDRLTRADLDRASLFPDGVVAIARGMHCASVAYTYSEPTSFYEYMLDTARQARAAGIKNVWVTNGYIQSEPLAELAEVLDAANVDLKSFSEETYRKLNAGKLAPILATLRSLREAGVWVEITNLVVPTYTDDRSQIQQLVEWIAGELGPDVPLHFSRFHPKYRLEHLPPTPVRTLLEARQLAHDAGLRYVYLGNLPGMDGTVDTVCPHCGRTAVRRRGFQVLENSVSAAGKCASCGARIAGVWG